MNVVKDVEVVAGTATAVVGGVGSLFSGLPLYLLLAVGISLVAGAGGTLWYANLYHECQAAGAKAFAEQAAIDKADNSKAIGQLNQKLTTTQDQYQAAMERLNAIPKQASSCGVSQYQHAVTDELCKLYPTSPSCGGSKPAGKVPHP